MNEKEYSIVTKIIKKEKKDNPNFIVEYYQSHDLMSLKERKAATRYKITLSWVELLQYITDKENVRIPINVNHGFWRCLAGILIKQAEEFHDVPVPEMKETNPNFQILLNYSKNLYNQFTKNNRQVEVKYI